MVRVLLRWIGMCGLVLLLAGCNLGTLADPSSSEKTPVAQAPIYTPTPAPEKRPTDTPVPEEPTPAPVEEATTLEIMEARGDFSIFLRLLDESGLLQELESGSSLTLLAPTDAAFRRFEEETTSLDRLREDRELLAQNLLYHLVPQARALDDLLNQQRVKTLQGATVTVLLDAARPKVNNAHIVESDIKSDTNIIHVIDTVLTTMAWHPADPPENLDERVAGWIPYPVGEPLPINDAELVPGHPLMQEAVDVMARVLMQYGSDINLARTVRLEENGEVKYLAPVLRPFYREAVYTREPVLIGILTVTGERVNELEPGAYAVMLTYLDAGKWLYQLIDARGRFLNEGAPLEVIETTGDDQVPAAGLYYGTVFCKMAGLGACFCLPCGPFFPNAFPNRAACQAACASQ